MNKSNYYNEKTIRDAIKLLKPNNELFEVRILQKANNRKKVISGYFKSADVLINALETVDPRQSNIYITINKVNEACYSREQHDCFRVTDATTHDHEIDKYEWLFIDLDPKRLAEISSTGDELKASEILADKVYAYMQEIGFFEPIRAMSGNGSHLLYRIDLDNTEEAKKLILKCLTVLANMFNTDTVKIDEVNHNQSRICKLYGTLAQKGANTKERPHRMSTITYAPDVIQINDIALLRKLASELPEVPSPQRQAKINTSNIQVDFDLESFMSNYGITPLRKDAGNGCVIYPLANCPFDSSHTNGDSKIFHYSDGAIAFKCHHNSCKDKKWQDVRLLYEPDAYDNKVDEENDRRIEEGWKKHKQQYLVVQKTDDIEQVKQSLPKLSAISAYELQQKVFDEKYYAVKDMIPEGETIIAAPPKTGKSWLVLDMCLKIAEGEPFLSFETNQSDTLYLALEDGDSFEQERLNIVLDGKQAPNNFHLVFSNVMPMNEGFLLQLDELLKAYPGIKVVVIDTLNFIKYRQGKSESAYECDYRTGRDLKQYAEEHKIAIVVVTHTTKMVHLDDDMANVSGTNGVTGAADAVIVIGKEKRTDLNAKLFITGRKVRQKTYNIKFNDEKCIWQYIGVAELESKEESEQKEREKEYFDSDIREAVIEISRKINESVTFSASQLIEMTIRYTGKGLKESNKVIGGFLGRMQGLFKAYDNVEIQIIKNGTASRLYKILPMDFSEFQYGDEGGDFFTIDNH